MLGGRRREPRVHAEVVEVRGAHDAHALTGAGRHRVLDRLEG